MIFAVVVTGIAAGLWFGRQQIVAAAPQAIRLYDLVGISVEPAGTQSAVHSEPTLTLGNVTSARRIVDGEPTLVIEGTITNSSEIEQPVPPLRAILRDKSGASLAEWSFAAEANSLSPGETAGFNTTRVKPPREATNLSVTLVGQPTE